MTRTLIKATLMLALAAAPALPQSKAANESFRLSMPKINSTLSAYTNLFELLAADPELAAKFKAAKKALPDKNGRDTLSLTAQKLAPTEPRVAAAFVKSGISPAEAGSTMETLTGVIFGVAMLDASKTGSEKLPPFVADNLAFYKQHKDEVQAAFQKFQANAGKAASALKGLDTDDEDEEDNDK